MAAPEMSNPTPAEAEQLAMFEAMNRLPAPRWRENRGDAMTKISDEEREANVRSAFEAWAFTRGWRNFTRDEHTGAYVVEGELELRWIGWRACAAEQAAAPE